MTARVVPAFLEAVLSADGASRGAWNLQVLTQATRRMYARAGAFG